MNILKSICRVVTLTVTLTLCASSWALPMTFEFSGTVTDTVLILNAPVKKTTTHPEWIGQQVTGTLVMDFVQTPENENMSSYYGAGLASDWMSLRINNPDGTFFDTADSDFINPTFNSPVTDLASVMLTHFHRDYYGVPQSDFILYRQYESLSPRLTNLAELGLRANGDNVGLLTNTVDFDDVVINPEFANMHNYGRVYQATRREFVYDYYFNIDTFERMDANVPEPAALLLLLSGLLVMGSKKYHFLNRS
ncbi:MAG: PEP-CTERM sorting domain-containing protein [Pseudomonadota bacterium]